MPHPDPLLLDLAAARPLGGLEAPAGLVDSAIEHRMGGLLWTAVAAGTVRLDEPSRRRLAEVDLVTRLQNRRLRAALASAARRAATIGVEFVTFKGVSADHRWYGREGERPAGDLDVLIAPEERGNIGRIIDALAPTSQARQREIEAVTSGRTPSIDLELEADPRQDAWSGAPVPLDLHADLLKYGIPDRQGSEVWARTSAWTIGEGVTVRVLQPEVALVQLVLHANRDRFRHLIAYADLARMLARESIDWPCVHAFVAREGIDVPVYSSLDAMTSALGLPAIEHPPVAGWRTALWQRLWPPSVRLQGEAGLRGVRRRRRCLPLMVRGRALEGLSAWVRGTS